MECLWVLSDAIVMIVIIFYQLIQRLTFLPATQLFFIKKSFYLTKTWPIRLVKSQQKPQKLSKVSRIHLLNHFQMLSNKLLPIDFYCFWIEARNFLHQSELNEYQSRTKHIWLIYIVLCESRVSLYYMCLPKDWR